MQSDAKSEVKPNVGLLRADKHLFQLFQVKLNAFGEIVIIPGSKIETPICSDDDSIAQSLQNASYRGQTLRRVVETTAAIAGNKRVEWREQ